MIHATNLCLFISCCWLCYLSSNFCLYGKPIHPYAHHLKDEHQEDRCFCLFVDDDEEEEEETLGILKQNLLLHMLPPPSLLLFHKHHDHMQVAHIAHIGLLWKTWFHCSMRVCPLIHIPTLKDCNIHIQFPTTHVTRHPNYYAFSLISNQKPWSNVVTIVHATRIPFNMPTKKMNLVHKEELEEVIVVPLLLP